MLWHCWLGDRKGNRPVKVGCWFVGDWRFACLIAPAVTTTFIILSSNKVQNGDILVWAYPGCPEKWPLNECGHYQTNCLPYRKLHIATFLMNPLSTLGTVKGVTSTTLATNFKRPSCIRLHLHTTSCLKKTPDTSHCFSWAKLYMNFLYTWTSTHPQIL